MELSDVRRLTGSSLILDRCGACGEASIPAGQEGLFVALWRRQMTLLLEAIGWPQEQIAVRPYPGGASLAVTAPLDGLYTATDLIEWAWEATHKILAGETAPAVSEAAPAFRRQIEEERNPKMIALAEAAARRGLTFLEGEDEISLGLGVRGERLPLDNLPAPEAIEWQSLHDIPVGLVTGTNGKSTTVRLTAAMITAAGRTVGLCSSDWVRVGGETIDEGDYSGPGGARRAVRDSRVETAVLEVARGGLMRRGLALPQADACLITNIAADHLGQYGITDVAALAEAKFVLARAVKPGGRLILNADDPLLVARSTIYPGTITWFSLAPAARGLAAWTAAGGEAAYLEDDELVLVRDRKRTAVLPVENFPLAMGGAARFNIANALGAIALASALKLPVAAMAEGLAGFKGGPDDNPGRGNFIELGGVRILIDFAHNPHGVAALIEAIKDLPARRRLYLLGQAGDRRDEDIRDLVRIVWETRPEKIVIKELAKALRGRAEGEVPEIIADELETLGAPPETIATADSELEATRQALQWAEPGDFLILLLHTNRKEALALLKGLEARGWEPGMPLD